MRKPTKEQITKWKANRKLWVKALRSGKYKKGMFQLKDSDGNFCCLGVLCEVIGMQGRLKRAENAYDRDSLYDTYYGVECQVAPRTAMRAVGLRNPNGSYGIGSALTDDNDEAQTTFDDIADTIEREPKRLFEEKL